jgi:hypothetical protein
MIKFFRKIRQNMIKENRASKYLLYAIGEIILVVIGILIALSINNWNNDQNLRRTEVALLKEMKKNLETDLVDIQWNINNNKTKLNANEIVLESLKNSESYNDTLNFYYGNLWGGTYFSKNTSAYDNLKSIGFHIIKNDSLRIRITELYSTKYNYLDILEEDFLDNFFSAKLQPLIISNIITDTTWISAKPINQMELAMNHEFKETLKINIFWIEYMIDLYEEIGQDVVTLINQIDNEIKDRNN